MPCQIGRASVCTVRLTDAGVFDQHARLELRGRSIHLVSAPEAFSYVNGKAEPDIALRNGDVVAFGAGKFVFELASPPRMPMRAAEGIIFALIIAATAAQVWLALTQ